MKLTEEQLNYTCGLWMGRSFVDLLNPTPEQINIDDMITNLDRTYRWKGAIPFTVNQHEALVAALAERWGSNAETQVEAMTHDGHEYVTGDIPAPFKDGLWFKGKDGSLNRVCDIQEKIQRCIREVIGLDASKVDFALVNKADLFAREMEYAYWFDSRGFYPDSDDFDPSIFSPDELFALVYIDNLYKCSDTWDYRQELNRLCERMKQGE